MISIDEPIMGYPYQNQWNGTILFMTFLQLKSSVGRALASSFSRNYHNVHMLSSNDMSKIQNQPIHPFGLTKIR